MKRAVYRNANAYHLSKFKAGERVIYAGTTHQIKQIWVTGRDRGTPEFRYSLQGSSGLIKVAEATLTRPPTQRNATQGNVAQIRGPLGLWRVAPVLAVGLYFLGILLLAATLLR